MRLFKLPPIFKRTIFKQKLAEERGRKPAVTVLGYLPRYARAAARGGFRWSGRPMATANRWRCDDPYIPVFERGGEGSTVCAKGWQDRKERQMNTGVGRAQLGQWYRRLDKAEIFRVVGLDTESRSVVIQNFGGDLDEIDEESWITLPLHWTEPPENWTGALDAIDINDCEYPK
jgi:hypothetical protein